MLSLSVLCRLLPTSSKLQHDEEAVAKISTNFADVVFDGTALKSVRYSRSDPGIRNPNSDRFVSVSHVGTGVKRTSLISLKVLLNYKSVFLNDR